MPNWRAKSIYGLGIENLKMSARLVSQSLTSLKKGKELRKEKMEFDNIELEPIRKDEITGIVLQADIADGQNQVASKQEVAEACEIWNEKFQHLTVQHRDRNGRLIDLEELTNPETFKDCFDSDFEIESSFIVNEASVLNGESIPTGSWLLSLKVLNSEIFELIREGRLNGYSIGAMGIKNQNGAVRISNLLVPEISIVQNPAHKRNFLIIKGEDFEEIRNPYPNEHACRLQSPTYSDYTRGTRISEGKEYSIIFGRNEEGNLEEQAYRYDKNIWTKPQARQHCSKHKGLSFEPAKKEE